METVAVEQSKMGRPKRLIGSTSIKVDDDACDLVRKAATFLGESVVDYASRVLREQARKDLREGAEKFLRENSDPEPPATKPPKKR